jgi:hypothetical protein
LSPRGDVICKAAKTAAAFVLSPTTLNALQMKTNTTAAQSAKNQTKKGWGFLAAVGITIILTIDGSLIITALGIAVFAIGAYKGGWMEKGVRA